MADKERSYLNPEFETDVLGKSMDELKDSASWNWDLAVRTVKKVNNQHKADKEWEEEHPEKKPGMLGTHTQSLLDRIED